MGVVILVPWRPGEERREFNWRVTRPYLERFGWELFLGDRPGPWARAAAVNAAARAAGDWDVALIADADTIPEEAPVRRAAEIVGDGAIRPHDRLWSLNASQSVQLSMTGPERVELRKTRLFPGGGLLVVSRTAWETVGGYDERFIGWGHEDSDLHTRLLVDASWDRIPGQAWHLWHKREAIHTPERLENRRMMEEIQERHRATIEAESARRGWDIGAYL
jgi:hypothetical protein